MTNAYYSALATDFTRTPCVEIHSVLEREHASRFTSSYSQATLAWSDSLPQLKAALLTLPKLSPDARVLLEYEIPRLASRIDCIILVAGIVFVIEFKSGDSSSISDAKRQVLRYRQELKDFHSQSASKAVVPVAIGEAFPRHVAPDVWDSPDPVIVLSGRFSDLGAILESVVRQWMPAEAQGDLATWEDAIYRPVPTIIEAVTSLFQAQDIREIAASRADRGELEAALEAVLELARRARDNTEKILCVLTGVPGAGKTLVGLSAVSLVHRAMGEDVRSVYLSGNGPLVRVLRASLTRWIRSTGWRDASGRKGTKKHAENYVQEMHRYATAALRTNAAQAERILIFDEAQRAWSAEHNAKKSKRRNPESGIVHEIDLSEAELVLRVMDRWDWCLVVALVGGGQEIHSGEAGLEAWGRALCTVPHWVSVCSPEALGGGSSVAGAHFLPEGCEINAEPDVRLHLDTSKRSLESEFHAQWANSLLAGQIVEASTIAADSERKVLITRDLSAMKNWLRRNGCPPYRPGLASSSGNSRLRAHGLEPPTFKYLQGIDYANWFLNDERDARSSYVLEVAMSEFELQGLELDYVGLCWGGDMVWKAGAWVTRSFVGNSWRSHPGNAKGLERRRLVLNKHRVLLTRFRKGLVIFVPPGFDADWETCAEMDGVAEVLLGAGCEVLRA